MDLVNDQPGTKQDGPHQHLEMKPGQRTESELRCPCAATGGTESPSQHRGAGLGRSGTRAPIQTRTLGVSSPGA